MKMKEWIMITLGALAFMMITGVAKSDENKITEVINSVGTHISNEIEETKQFQKNSWADAKAQLLRLKAKFGKTESNQ